MPIDSSIDASIDASFENPKVQPTHEDYTPLSKPSVTYQSYLLRLWHEGGANTPWRATLESVTEPDERQNFANMESLFAFLRECSLR